MSTFRTSRFRFAAPRIAPKPPKSLPEKGGLSWSSRPKNLIDGSPQAAYMFAIAAAALYGLGQLLLRGGERWVLVPAHRRPVPTHRRHQAPS